MDDHIFGELTLEEDITTMFLTHKGCDVCPLPYNSASCRDLGNAILMCSEPGSNDERLAVIAVENANDSDASQRATARAIMLAKAVAHDLHLGIASIRVDTILIEMFGSNEVGLQWSKDVWERDEAAARVCSPESRAARACQGMEVGFR